LIGRERTRALADTPYGYRWIYRTVVEDWDALSTLLTSNGLVPIVPADKLRTQSAKAKPRRRR
jgi:hypothetical protein